MNTKWDTLEQQWGGPVVGGGGNQWRGGGGGEISGVWGGGGGKVKDSQDVSTKYSTWSNRNISVEFYNQLCSVAYIVTTILFCFSPETKIIIPPDFKWKWLFFNLK